MIVNVLYLVFSIVILAIVYTNFCHIGSSSGLLLEQKVPAKYIELEDVVSKLADERVMEKKDPVLHADQYQ